MMKNGFDSLQGQNIPPCITEIDFLHPTQEIQHENSFASKPKIPPQFGTRLYVSYVGSSRSLPCSFRSPRPNNSPMPSFQICLAPMSEVSSRSGTLSFSVRLFVCICFVFFKCQGTLIHGGM